MSPAVIACPSDRHPCREVARNAPLAPAWRCSAARDRSGAAVANRAGDAATPDDPGGGAGRHCVRGDRRRHVVCARARRSHAVDAAYRHHHSFGAARGGTGRDKLLVASRRSDGRDRPGAGGLGLPGGPCRTAGGRRQPGAGGHGFLSGKHRSPGRQRRPPLVAARGADHTTGVGPAPAVASDGTAYVATAGGDLDAIGADGQRRWRARLGLPLLFRPAVGSDGTIYVSTYIQGRGLVFAVTPQGTLRWERAVTAGSDVAVGADGTIYLAARDVVALTPRGQVRWHRVVGTTAPPVALDGGVAVSQLSPPALVAFDASGAVRWQTPLPRPLTGPPALGPAGRLYGADVTASVLALATGAHGAGRVLPLKASAGPPVNPGANDPPFYVQRGAVAWRVTLAQTVERRVGNGAWQTVLTPGRPGVDAATGRVIPQLYGSISFLALDPHDSGLYVGTEGVLGNYQLGGQGGATGGLYYSPDGIGHWESRSSGLPYTYEPRLHVPTYGIASLTIDSKQRGHLFAQISPDFGAPGLDAGLYISQDGGLHWAAGNHGLQAESRGNGLLGFYNAYPPGELLIDPTRPWILYLVAPTGLYRSPDRGLHWGRVAGVTYDDPTTVAVRLSTRGAASAFTDQGQFASSDYGEHWRLVRSYQIPTVQFPVSGAPFYAPPPTPVPPTPAARARSTATEVAPATGTAAASQQQIGASPLWPLMKARIGPSMTLPRGRIACVPVRRP